MHQAFYVVLLVAALAVILFAVRHRPKPTLFLAYRSSNLTIKAHQMEIQGIVGTTKVFDVIATGTQGENMNVPVSFSLDNPTLASTTFDQASMTVSVTFTGIGSGNLVEQASGTSVSTTHTIKVSDQVASVDLREHQST